MLNFFKSFKFPANTSLLYTFPFKPCSAISSTPSAVVFLFGLAAYSVTAFAIGCVEFFSIAEAYLNSSSFDMLFAPKNKHYC
jgi:hypothetical protein